MWETPLYGTVCLGTAKLTTVCFVCAPNSSMWDTLYGAVGQGLKVSHLSEFDCIVSLYTLERNDLVTFLPNNLDELWTKMHQKFDVSAKKLDGFKNQSIRF